MNSSDVLNTISGLLGPIVGVIGIILSSIVMKKEKATGTVDGMTKAALILSIIGTAISIIIFIVIMVLVTSIVSAVHSISAL